MTKIELRVLKWLAERGVWNKWGRAHAAVYKLTRGLIGHSSGNITNLLLTTTGRKSGTPRTVPLSYIRWQDKVVVVASNGGADRPPIWWLNLLADPRASIQIEGTTAKVRARAANAEEEQQIWPRLHEENFFYTRHLANTDRHIPVVILTSQEDQTPSDNPAERQPPVAKTDS